MVKKRNRFKQSTTFEHRLLKFTDNLRQQAKSTPAGADQVELMRRIRKSEAALKMDAMLRANTFEFTE